MNFLRSRSEQLAEYLRGLLARGELAEPLPGRRAWAEKLEVSPTTLKSVLKTLQREGLIVVEPRKPIRLARATVPRPIPESKLVRVVYCTAEYPDQSMFAWFPQLAQSLFEHGIHAALESCTFARLRALSRQNPALPDLLVLASVPAEYQLLSYRSNIARSCTGIPIRIRRFPSSTQTSTAPSAMRHTVCCGRD